MEIHPVVTRLERYLLERPSVSPEAYIAPNVTILGKVAIGPDSSVWFQSVLRADINEISIGNRTNIQDGCMLHVADRFGLKIGHGVSCGHRAILHACTVEDDVLIGMGAVVLDGAQVGTGSIIGANTLVTKGSIIPPGSLVLGTPGKVIRRLTAEEKQGIPALAQKYVAVAKYYLARR